MANLSNINNKFLVTTGGNVLIGQTAVVGTSILQVEGSTNAIIRMNSTAGTGGRMDFAYGGSNYGNIGSGKNILGTGNAADMMINADSLLILGVGSQDMTILPSGDVGIGISLPTTKLHLGGTAPGDSIIRQDSTTSGTNWEIGERAAGKWQIFEDDGDSIVATFMSIGRVGIGNPSPTYQLDVLGSGGNGGIIHVKNTDAVQYPRLAIQSDVKGYHIGVGGSGAGAGYANNLYFYDNNEAAVRMVIDTNGDVGIGTASPNYKLQVEGTASKIFNVTNTSTYSRMLLTGASGTGGDLIFSEASTGTPQFGIYSSGAQATSTLGIYPSDGSSPAILVKQNGNVGINNTSPAKKLEISSPTSSDGILLTGDGTGGGFATGQYREIGFSYTDTDTSYGSSIKFEVPDSTNHGGQISFWTDSLTTAPAGLPVRAMTISRSQNVGIGTSSPGARIDIKGVAGSPATSGTTQNGILRIQNATNNNTLDIGQVAGSPYGTWLQAADKSDLNPTYTYPILLNPLGGNVGIGVTSPSYKLEVNGNMRSSTVTVYDGMGGSETGIGASGAGGNLRLYAGGTNRVTVATSAVTLGVYAQDTIGSNYIQFYNSAGTAQGYMGFGASATNDMIISQESANVNIRFLNGGSERMRIDSGGTVTIPGVIESGGGIKLGGTATANKLNDYEEGTWTPSITAAGGNSATATYHSPIYTKVGRIVNVAVYIHTINIAAITSGTYIQITGFPFTAENYGDFTASYHSGGWSGGVIVGGYVQDGGNYAYLMRADGGEANQTSTDLVMTRFMLNVTYQTT